MKWLALIIWVFVFVWVCRKFKTAEYPGQEDIEP